MSQQIKHRVDKGFSMVELLVALTIFSIGLLALAGMQFTAIKGNSSAHSLTALTALADGLAEDLLSLNGDNTVVATSSGSATSWPTSFASPGTPQQWDIDGAGLCTATYQVTADAPITGVSTIEIVVTSPSRTLTKQVLKRTY